MATAEYKPEVTEVVEPETFTLHLSRDEAETLTAILGLVGGQGANTRRKYADSVADALNRMGVAYPDIESEEGDTAGTIYFLRDDQRGTHLDRQERYGNSSQDFKVNPVTEPKREVLAEWERELLREPLDEHAGDGDFDYCCPDCDGY